jgi:hypothetical protein
VLTHGSFFAASFVYFAAETALPKAAKPSLLELN